MGELTHQEAQAKVDAVAHRWWHSIDLGDGLITPGTKPMATMQAEIAALDLPDLRGKSVLDIGAWDGAFSFECERRGADKVVALDHFIWSVDLDAQQGYLERCAAEGTNARPWDEVPEVWKPDELPGKAGFDAAHEILGSKVEAIVADFLTMDLDDLGQFDVVLYLGVLYHMPDPLGSLRRVARVTRELALVETEMMEVSGGEHHAVCEFLAADELGRDPTNWWVPNRLALLGLLRAAGFGRAVMPPAPPLMLPAASRAHRRVARALLRERAGQPLPYHYVPPAHYRGLAHAWKDGAALGS